MAKSVLLCILDGWGVSDEVEFNAIAKGDTPVFDQLNRDYPFTPIHSSGEEVGLPPGQMGNSEVGHLNIGAGRVVYQDIMRISNAINNESINENEALSSPMRRVIENGKKLHLMGLVSDGGVHSHIDHLVALVKMAKDKGVAPDKIFIHALTDGRDTPPDSGKEYLNQLEESLTKIGAGKITSVTGRFYAMDRDKRWDRVEKAYRAFTHGAAKRFDSADKAIDASYANEVYDEFIEPSLVGDFDGIADDDELIMFNFRADRMREIVSAFFDKDFDYFDRGDAPLISVTCMTEYDATFNLPIAFQPEPISNTLGEVVASHHRKQLRTAETEKYAHVTFFFNGGVEPPNEGEVRKLVPSPKVRTYDLKPEMSCKLVTDGVVEAIEANNFDLIVVNLANGDMVGHTGIWEAALSAVSVIDESVGRIVDSCGKAGRELLIISDHGNIEKMEENGKPMTAHTTNPSPFYYIGSSGYKLRASGALCDVAPTILQLMEIDQPDEMTGRTMLVKE